SASGALVEAVERVVHLDVPDLREAGLGGQVAQRRLGQPEGAQAFAALGEGGGHAVQDRESVEQRGDGTHVGGGLVRAVDLQAEVAAAGPQRVPDRAEQAERVDRVVHDVEGGDHVEGVRQPGRRVQDLVADPVG